MSNDFRRKLAILALLTGVFAIVSYFGLTVPVYAADCGGVETAIIDCASANDATGSPVVAVLVLVIQILTGLVGIVAIGAFIYAGIMYSSASGESSQIAKAKEIMLNTVLGLVIFAAMAVMLNYLIPGGLFTGTAKFGAGGNGLGDQILKDTTNSGTGSGDNDDLSEGTVDITVATYNIRATDLTSWDSVRANSILNYMKTVDIVGIQEGRNTSNSWLMPRMKKAGYSWSTAGKAANARKIYFSAKKFTLAKQGSKTINDKKDVVWVKLKEKTSGTQFYVANVHLDVASTSARLSNLKTALPYIKNTLNDAPVIFIGDMNSKRGSTEDKMIQSYGFKDSYDIATTKTNLQYRTTIPNFTGGTSGTIQVKQHQVDHIYLKGNLAAKSIAVILHKGSDHLPVQATIGIADNRSSPKVDFSVSLQGVQNFRDLAMLNSNIIKPGVIYRSAKLSPATTSDKTKLATTLKNGIIIDLRTPSVIADSPDPRINGVANLNYPVTAATSAKGYVDSFVNDAAVRKQFGLAITKIANTSGPVLIHCTAGKDRTGWLSSMLLYAAGASDKQVMTEYLKSNDAGSYFSVDKTWLNAALTAARKNNGGSIMTYIASSSNGLGVSQDTIAKLKAKISK